jgi:hypothetical protein
VQDQVFTHAPDTRLHVSTVHLLPSEHWLSAVHFVQPSIGWYTHSPFAALHDSVVHGFPSPHSIATCLHVVVALSQ